FFFSSRRRHTRSKRDWSSDVCSSDLLLIADDFDRVEYAVYEDRFKDVMVKDHKFERQFMMSEVFYLTYNNEKIQRYVNELFSDYGELFGRMMDSQLRKNQLRALVK